ncbi:hypothetical protein [Sphaerisporangium fuscum]|nr:hypothetical protein [Sphaerisporangium fuscum]
MGVNTLTETETVLDVVIGDLEQEIPAQETPVATTCVRVYCLPW